MVNGSPRRPPVSDVIVTVYDVTMMLSSALGMVTVGFLRLLRRVTHAVVVVPATVDDGMLETMGDPVVLSENPSTDKNVNALPLCPDPPSQAARRVTMASVMTAWQARAGQTRAAAARGARIPFMAPPARALSSRVA
jgi:hypothetical protein